MTHTYKVTGMTCENCGITVKSSLLMLPGITEVDVSVKDETAVISMDKHVALSALQKALGNKYTISPAGHHETAEQARNWFSTYKPVLLLAAFITAVSLIAVYRQEEPDWLHGMNVFMAGFFLTFSFFKFLDLDGFAESYSMYDIVAKRVRAWGYIYAFVELLLGIAYATGFAPSVTNIITVVVMTVSLIGVLQSIFNKRKIRCACLGVVFNLPMSTVTVIEDALMIGMSGIMLLVMM